MSGWLVRQECAAGGHRLVCDADWNWDFQEGTYGPERTETGMLVNTQPVTHQHIVSIQVLNIRVTSSHTLCTAGI